MHIDTVRNSGRAGEIRLVKLWRHLAGLDFPSFYLELCVLEALHGRRYGQLAANLSLTLEWLHANLETRRIIDPANTANCISDDLTQAEKRMVAQAAGVARACPYYSDFVW